MIRPLTLIAVLVLLGARPSPAATWTLEADGSGDFATLQDAINAAANGDTILLEAGTYTGTGNRSVNLLGKALTIESVSGTAATILDIEGSPAFPSRALMFHTGEGPDTIVRGLTLRNGYATGKGALVRIIGASPTFENVSFESGLLAAAAEWGGGAVYVTDGAPTFTDCAFEDNVVDGGPGGAIHLQAGSMTAEGCRFEGNSSWYGGAVRAEAGSDASFHDCAFLDNGPYMVTGGIGGAVAATSSDVGFSACYFFSNTALEGQGGSIAANSGSLTVEGCNFVNESSYFGGAIFIAESSSVLLAHSRFHANESQSGGAISLWNVSDYTIEGCVLSHNDASYQYLPDTGGGAVFLKDSSGTIRSSSVLFNVASQRGSAFRIVGVSHLALVNTLVAFNGTDDPVSCSGSDWTVWLECCDFWDNSGTNFGTCVAGWITVNGNFAADPLFCNAPGYDFTLDGDSPCLPDHNGCGRLVGALGWGCGDPTAVFPDLEILSWGQTKARYR
jgi:hypothetical protein